MAFVLVVLAMTASACGAGSESSLESLVSTTTMTTIDGDVEELPLDQTFELDADVDAGRLGPDPVDDEPQWECDGLTLSLDDLLELDALPGAEVDAFAVATQFESLGSIDEWAELSDERIVNRRLIDSNPPALLLGNTLTGGSSTCVPLRASWMQPVAWEQLDGPTDGVVLIAHEPCASDPVVDVRSVGDDVLLGLFTSVREPTSCVVDGSATIEIDVAGGGVVLSSQRWPFEPGDPTQWFVDQDHAPVAPIDDSVIASIECAAEASAAQVFVGHKGVPAWAKGTFYANDSVWLGMEGQAGLVWRRAVDRAWADRLVEYGNPAVEGSLLDGGFSFFGARPGEAISFELQIDVPGGTTRRIDCGTVALPEELPGPSCSIVDSAGQPRLVVDDGMDGLGLVQVMRDGAPLDLGFRFGGLIDTTAEPGVTYEYSVTVMDGLTGRESVSAPCGSFSVVAAADRLEELLRAQELFQVSAIGAHVYMTVIPASGVPIDAAMSFQNTGHEFVVPAEPPIAADPFTLHDRLLDAVREGADVTFAIDSFAGVPTQWSIGDESFEITCLSIDTAPPSQRDVVCDPASDLIGSPD